MKIRKTPPKPQLVVNVEMGIYAWKCECKYLLVYANSAEKAVQAWIEAKYFEESLL